jgi:NitT/TauT family transport system substrate-binding protein
LDSVGLSERDIKVVNTSDADIVAAFSSKDVQAAVFWNPQLSEALKMPDTVKVFDSSNIPGEIIDLTVVNSATLKDNPKLGKALTGAWFETMTIMSADDKAGKEARSFMGKSAGTDLAGYDHQLSTTKMYYLAKDAVTFSKSPDLVKTMDSVRKFSFDHGLLGEGAKSVDAVGIAFPGGKTLGEEKNVKLRFTDMYMDMAAGKKL